MGLLFVVNREDASLRACQAKPSLAGPSQAGLSESYQVKQGIRSIAKQDYAKHRKLRSRFSCNLNYLFKKYINLVKYEDVSPKS